MSRPRTEHGNSPDAKRRKRFFARNGRHENGQEPVFVLFSRAVPRLHSQKSCSTVRCSPRSRRRHRPAASHRDPAVKGDFLQGQVNVAPFGYVRNWDRAPFDNWREATSTHTSAPFGRSRRISRVAPAVRGAPTWQSTWQSFEAVGSASARGNDSPMRWPASSFRASPKMRGFRIGIAYDAIVIRQDEAYRHVFDHRTAIRRAKQLFQTSRRAPSPSGACHSEYSWSLHLDAKVGFNDTCDARTSRICAASSRVTKPSFRPSP